MNSVLIAFCVLGCFMIVFAVFIIGVSIHLYKKQMQAALDYHKMKMHINNVNGLSFTRKGENNDSSYDNKF